MRKTKMRKELRELLKTHFPTIIKQTRVLYNTTQEQMSAMLHIDNRSLQELEAGNSAPSLTTYLVFKCLFNKSDFSQLDKILTDYVTHYDDIA